MNVLLCLGIRVHVKERERESERLRKKLENWRTEGSYEATLIILFRSWYRPDQGEVRNWRKEKYRVVRCKHDP